MQVYATGAYPPECSPGNITSMYRNVDTNLNPLGRAPKEGCNAALFRFKSDTSDMLVRKPYANRVNK